MKANTLIGNIIVYVACIALCGAVIWQIATGQADTTWHWFRGLPLVWQVILAIIFLPWLAALWVWQTGWPLPVRWAFIVAIILFVLVVFFPRAPAT